MQQLFRFSERERKRRLPHCAADTTRRDSPNDAGSSLSTDTNWISELMNEFARRIAWQTIIRCMWASARDCFINHSRFATHCFLRPVCYRLVCIWAAKPVDSVSSWRIWVPRARLTLANILIYICCTTAVSDFRSMMLLHRRRLWKSDEKKNRVKRNSCRVMCTLPPANSSHWHSIARWAHTQTTQSRISIQMLEMHWSWSVGSIQWNNPLCTQNEKTIKICQIRLFSNIKLLAMTRPKAFNTLNAYTRPQTAHNASATIESVRRQRRWEMGMHCAIHICFDSPISDKWMWHTSI